MALVDNILAYWKLDDDGSGAVSLVDSTGNSNTLTNYNGVTLGTGIIAGDAILDGSNSLYSGNIFTGSGDWSVSAWVKPQEVAYYSALITATNFNFYLNTDNSVSVNDRFSQSDIESVGNVPNGAWSYLTIISSSGTTSLYIDGLFVASTTQAINPIDYASIGTLSESQWFLSGQIDEVGIWSRSLSISEITDLYNSGYGLTYPFIPSLYFSGGNLSTLSNWWKDPGFTIAADSLPDEDTPVVISENATSGSLICSTATIIDASNAGDITGDCTFNGTSSNSGNITGDADVYHPAQNPLGGDVSGTISYFWPNGTGIWGGDVWFNGDNVVVIPAENEVKAGVVYGFPSDPLTGTYTGSGGGGGSDTTISRLLNLPWFIKI